MPKKKIRLRIVTPAKVKVDEPADMIIMRCTSGDMGVLPGHEPRSAVLDYAPLRIRGGGYERHIAVYGGLAVIENDVLTILTDDAEWPEEIDLAQARADRERAEQRLRDREDDMELQYDQVLLRRALVQIEVSSNTLTQEDE